MQSRACTRPLAAWQCQGICFWMSEQQIKCLCDNRQAAKQAQDRTATWNTDLTHTEQHKHRTWCDCRQAAMQAQHRTATWNTDLTHTLQHKAQDMQTKACTRPLAAWQSPHICSCMSEQQSQCLCDCRQAAMQAQHKTATWNTGLTHTLQHKHRRCSQKPASDHLLLHVWQSGQQTQYYSRFS